jgi:XTP/dITP diphosphohydrolase
MRALLAGQDAALVDLEEIGLALDVAEDGPDYEAIARGKAASYATASGLWTIADDTGLEVQALGGRPGIRSARLASDDRSRRVALLALLSDRPRPWPARFRCAVALAGPRGESVVGHGSCPGEIIPEERGDHGFGYDPLFLVEGTGLTMAELPLARKNLISHRARAVQDLLARLMQGAPPGSPLGRRVAS